MKKPQQLPLFDLRVPRVLAPHADALAPDAAFSDSVLHGDLDAGERGPFSAARPFLKQVSPAQLRALHSLFTSYAPRFFPSTSSADVLPTAAGLLPGQPGVGEADFTLRCEPLAASPDVTREQRLAVASRIIGRHIASFTELSSAEAARLIDMMKRALGRKIRPARKRPDRDQAQAYGTHGRRSSHSKEIRLVDEQTLDLIDSLVARLGWDAARFEGFLRSASSPLRSGAIRTLPEANKIIWALRNMLRKKERSNSDMVTRRAR